MKPNKENITKWVKALRSGRYKQTYGMLKSNVGYCCLGVACSVSRQGKWTSNNVYRLSTGELEDAELPNVVAEWLGISQYKKLYKGKSLIGMNDELEMNFSEIADVIEKEYLNEKGR